MKIPELNTAIEQILLERPEAAPERLADELVKRLGVQQWIVESDQIGRAFLTAQIRRAQRTAPDPRAGWLPGYEHISSLVRGNTLEQYRERIAFLERRIHNYDYPRRSPEKLKQDKTELREMKRLEPKITPYFAGVAEMTVDRAAELLQAHMEKPSVRNKIKGGKARQARMKNQ